MSSGWQLDDTIAALASPPGSAARGIIRLSGAGCRQVLGTCFTPDEPERMQVARRAVRFCGVLRLDDAALSVSAAVCLWPGSRSYTGEPAAELQLPGSPPLLEAVLARLHVAGARPARPGEFTLRAFLAGRIDLVQAEAVLGVIDAGDQNELQQALRQLSGGLSAPVTELRSSLLNLLADLEAGLDFVEEDIEFVSTDETLARLDEGRSFIRRLLEQDQSRGRSGSRWRVVLAGQPNAGKSTLFNALCGREGAIVSPVRGTTRDWLSAVLIWQGLPIELVDTAGQEDTPGGIASQMQQQRHSQFEQADLIVWCTAATLSDEEQQQDTALRSGLQELSVPWLQVRTMADLVPEQNTDTADTGDGSSLAVSAVSGRGLDALLQAAGSRLTGDMNSGAARLRQMLGSTQSRCRASLEEAQAALDAARRAAEDAAGDELVAMELRTALDELGQVAGTVCTNDLLDRIFSRFCIGK